MIENGNSMLRKIVKVITFLQVPPYRPDILNDDSDSVLGLKDRRHIGNGRRGRQLLTIEQDVNFGRF